MLGLCCHWLNSSEQNTMKLSHLQLGRFNSKKYTHDRIKQTYVSNLEQILFHLPIIYDSGIKVFRMSSSAFPLWDKVPRVLWDNDETSTLLQLIGKYVKSHLIRLTTHPGQFVVLSSPNKNTQTSAVRELNFHGWVFDKMGLDQSPFYSINVHGGGKCADRRNDLVSGIKMLNISSRSRLTLENCEFGWSAADLCDISDVVDVPVCFDSHHHKFNTGGLCLDRALKMSNDTWRNIKPMTHLSNSRPNLSAGSSVTKLRAHSDYIVQIPPLQKDLNNKNLIDIDVEAKKKNLAIFDMSAALGIVIS